MADPWQLTKGWKWSTVGDLTASIQSGFAHGKKGSANGDLLHLRPYNIGLDGEVYLGQTFYVPRTVLKNGDSSLEAGDVLFNNTNSVELVGKTAIIRNPLTAAFSNHITLIKTRKDRCEGTWLALVLRALWQTGFFAQRCNKWIGQAGYNTTALKDTPVPLPPTIEEQRRIVAKIEALFDRIREAKRLRTEVLADVESLTDAAREEALSRLGTIKFELLVASYKNGIYKPKHYYGRGYPSVRMFNIHDGKVNLEKAPLLDVTGEELNLYGLEPDDVLINRVNSRELVGKSGLVPPRLGPCTFESKNIRVRIKCELAEPAFVVAALNSKSVKQQILGKQKPAIGQATVNQDDLSELQIPFTPDLEEQRRVVAYLHSVAQQVSGLEHGHEETDAELKRLEQSILDRAFHGEL